MSYRGEDFNLEKKGSGPVQQAAPEFRMLRTTAIVVAPQNHSHTHIHTRTHARTQRESPVSSSPCSAHPLQVEVQRKDISSRDSWQLGVYIHLVLTPVFIPKLLPEKTECSLQECRHHRRTDRTNRVRGELWGETRWGQAARGSHGRRAGDGR